MASDTTQTYKHRHAIMAIKFSPARGMEDAPPCVGANQIPPLERDVLEPPGRVHLQIQARTPHILHSTYKAPHMHMTFYTKTDYFGCDMFLSQNINLLCVQKYTYTHIHIHKHMYIYT